MNRSIRIAPSILAADFSNIGEEVKAMTEAGADYIHVDVMDGHFVPNLTIGPDIIKSMRPHSALPFDVHLMISPVDPSIDHYVKAGADILTVHLEAGPHIYRTIQKIKSAGIKAGLALNPGTPADAVDFVIADVDLILVMTVNPGFGGQSFIDSQLDKIRSLRNKIDVGTKPIDLEVDGGINFKTAPRTIEAGADILVAGTAAFAGGRQAYSANISKLRGAP
jgi:ribulose-phosphate 3-epimerase